MDSISISEIELYSLEEILKATLVLKSNLKPSEWYESRMIMPANDPFPGPVKFSRTPYWEEPFNCIDPNHPALNVTIMGPAQMGKSMMVLNAIIAYIISENPVNILFLTGHSDLSKEAMEKIDFVIKCCGLDHLITPNVLKKKNNRSGDTAAKKEFRGADLKSGSVTNHNLLRQNTARVLLSDDLDAGKLGKDETGSTIGLINGRAKASEDKSKKYWVSTPQVKGRSLIEIQFNKSDKRYFNLMCPHCGNSEKRIVLQMPFKVDSGDMAGLTWKLDNIGRVDPKTVGYICQLCANLFTDKNKHELLNTGIWVPTCEPLEYFHYGYSINGLYAPTGMTSWLSLASKYVACYPPGLPRIERDYQTFINIDIGELYEELSESPEATDLMKNCRTYEVGVIPESTSEADGNGDIILLQLACDCNGTLNDARIDYEIKAFSRKGASYSVQYGSLGTFIPNQSAEQKANTTREKWTYEMYRENSVWKLLDEVLGKTYKTDTGREMKIYISGIDVGHLTDNIYNYIDKSNFRIIGLMGDKEHDYVLYAPNKKIFTKASSNSNMYLLNVNMIKDDLAGRMRLKWDKQNDSSQPHLFLNYPQYSFDGFFKQYESEHKVEKQVGRQLKFMWTKKSPTHQNHFFDCCVYHIGLLDILLDALLSAHAKKNPEITISWASFSKMIPLRQKKAA